MSTASLARYVVECRASARILALEGFPADASYLADLASLAECRLHVVSTAPSHDPPNQGS